MDGSRLIIYGLVILAIALLLGLMRWQNHTQTRPAGLEFEAVQPDPLPSLLQGQVTDYTTQLESLGCERLGDYRVTADIGVLPPTMLRVFQHSLQQYFAVLSQTLSDSGQSASLTCTIHSLLEDDWTIVTTNERPSSLTPLLHLPRLLWSSDPKALPSQLVEAHLSQREQVVLTLDLAVLADVPESDFLVKLKETAWRQKQRLRRQNLVTSFSQALYSKLRPQRHWLGDYPDAVKRHRQEL